jgi:formylglycine-generating enzyme required for sulfatase activity
LFVSLALAAEPDAELLKSFREGFVPLKVDAEAKQAKLTAPLAVHRYEVTQEVYEAATGADPSRWKGPQNSVEMVSFEEAKAFCVQMTKALRSAKLIGEKEEVRLPTEAEWEFAARGGTKTAYHFGDDPKGLGDYAWFHGNAAGNDPPVGAKKPNDFGLYDVHGYLWEWCSPTLATPDEQKPGENEPDAGAVLRGGSWKEDAEKLTIAIRRPASVDLRDDAVGFRCVLAPVP